MKKLLLSLLLLSATPAMAEDLWQCTACTAVAPPIPANNPPVANDDLAEGTAPFTAEGNVLDNDSDPDGDPLSVEQPNSAIAADGSYSIDITDAGEFIFPYTVTDGKGGTASTKLTVIVEAAPEPPIPPAEVLAFPGAEGAGRFAKGGRGGVVMLVNNLNDVGPGSLRACAEATEPRTCVLRTSGYIVLKSTIRVSDPFITLAGEAAPGQGITLRSYTGDGTPADKGNISDLMVIRTHDVIIRHMRFRGGHPPHGVSSNGRNLMIGDIYGPNPVYNVIADHISASWATDQPMDVSPSNTPRGEASPVSRVTLQDSLVYEGLRNHSKGPNYRICGVSTIRTLIASNTIRNPNNTCGKYDPVSTRAGGGVTGENEFRNNMVYNGSDAFFDMWDGRGEAWVNIVGNVFKRGPQSKSRLGSNIPHGVFPVEAWRVGKRLVPSGTCEQNNDTPDNPDDEPCDPDADPLHMYLEDNIMIGFGTILGGPPIEQVLNPNDAHLVSETPVGDGEFEDGVLGPAMPASEVQDYIMGNAGAFPRNRDSADIDILTDVQNSTGAIPTCTTSTTATDCEPLPYPVLEGGIPYPDADEDGMDDNWEIANGVSDPNGDKDKDGWTDLEEFLHGLAETR